MKINAMIAVTFIIITATSSFAADILPDKKSTEGSVRPDGHERDQVCGAAKQHHGPMTPDRSDEVLIRYGLPPGLHPDYGIDHLIPLSLGGSDDFTNLWPQPRSTIEPRWNAEAKDRLERRLCEMVCTGKTDLTTAQEEIAADWIATYLNYFRVKDFVDEWSSIPDPNERWLLKLNKEKLPQLSPEEYAACKRWWDRRGGTD